MAELRLRFPHYGSKQEKDREGSNTLPGGDSSGTDAASGTDGVPESVRASIRLCRTLKKEGKDERVKEAVERTRLSISHYVGTQDNRSRQEKETSKILMERPYDDFCAAYQSQLVKCQEVEDKARAEAVTDLGRLSEEGRSEVRQMLTDSHAMSSDEVTLLMASLVDG